MVPDDNFAQTVLISACQQWSTWRHHTYVLVAVDVHHASHSDVPETPAASQPANNTLAASLNVQLHALDKNI